MMNSIHTTGNESFEGLICQAFEICKENTEQIRTSYAKFQEANYFLEVIENYYHPEKMKESYPRIIVLGTDFPMEIIHALTKKPPYWIIGGNREFLSVSDEYVPRDTDHVTRGVLGQLMTMEHVKETALVVIPCSSDAQRKIAYFLQNHGWKVVTIWIPAVQDAQAYKSFLSELEHAISTICRHVGKRYSVRALKKSTAYINEIRESIHAFLCATHENEKMVPGPMRMAVMDSFFMTDDLETWHAKLKELTEAIKKKPMGHVTDRPRVLVIGSPIYFPNFKIPCLLHDAGLEVCGSIDARAGQYENIFSNESQRGLPSLASYYFVHDSSSAFVNNDQLVEAIRHYVKVIHPDGIIWHVLKGQIEYDFELARNEAFFEEQNLPVIRLETDYMF